jgi:hypothetical protein
MTASDDKLILLLQQRNADRQRATDGGIHPRKAVPAVAIKALQAAERALGFKLPDLVRTLHLQIANGGFGPQYGIVGIKGGAKLDDCTLEMCYRKLLKLEKQNPVWRWPRGLLPLANYGCGTWSCVDCEYAKLPMILWDPNNLDAELEGSDAQLNWGNSFWDQGLSLKSWLAGKPEPEPKWPRDSWMKKRLDLR